MAAPVKVTFMQCSQCGVEYGNVRDTIPCFAEDKLGCGKCLEWHGKSWPYFIDEVKESGVCKTLELGWTVSGNQLKPLGCNICKTAPEIQHVFRCGHRACPECKPSEEDGLKCGECGTEGLAAPGSDILGFYQSYYELATEIGLKNLKGRSGAAFQRLLRQLALMERLNGVAEADVFDEGNDEPEEISPKKYNCDKCSKENEIEDCFHCTECQQTICGSCCVKFHKAHDTPSRVKIELEQLGEATAISLKGLYEGYAGNLSGLHLYTKEAFTSLMAAEEIAMTLIAKQETFQKGKEVAEEIKKTAEGIEHECEGYIPFIRIFNDKVMDARDKLAKLSTDFASE